MFTLARFLISLIILSPSLIHAAALLENPGPGTTPSGIGVISGWKCQADGDLTIRFDGGDAIPLLYGSERTDVRDNGQCLENDHDNVGFVAIWNWGRLDNGEHTAVAYDNGVEFARNTFTVVRASEDKDFLPDVTAECSVFDFPYAGTNAHFKWNTGTQHLELAEVGEDVEVPVSTRFDGEWELSAGYTDDDHTCDDIPSVGLIQGDYDIENGEIISGVDFTLGGSDFGLVFLGLVSPNGDLEGHYRLGLRDEEGYFVRNEDKVVGTLVGFFIEEEGIFLGEWMYGNYRCNGLFDLTKQ